MVLRSITEVEFLTDEDRNRSFLLFKPHADTSEVRLKVHSILNQKGIDIVGAGEILLSAADGGKDVVDEHFREMSRNATELLPAYAN